MTRPVTADTLHRTAKFFMDSGRADSHEQAIEILNTFGLCISVGPELSSSRDHQIALLTLVNLACRTFLGGVHVAGVPKASLLAPLADATSLRGAVTELGGWSLKSMFAVGQACTSDRLKEAAATLAGN